MQNRSFHRIPNWFLMLIAFGFMAHFSLVIVHQFGKERLPKPVVAAAESYIVPWFYQNYLMFAPDPTHYINTFLYRTKEADTWSDWKNPVFEYQQAHWANRLGTGSDWYDLYNGLADLIFDATMVYQFKPDTISSDFHQMKAYALAKKAVLRNHPHAEAIQVGVLTEHHRVDDNHKVEVFTIFQAIPPEQL